MATTQARGSARSIWPGRYDVIEHIVDTHPEVDDDVWLLAWTVDGGIVCQACPDHPTE